MPQFPRYYNARCPISVKDLFLSLSLCHTARSFLQFSRSTSLNDVIALAAPIGNRQFFALYGKMKAV